MSKKKNNHSCNGSCCQCSGECSEHGNCDHDEHIMHIKHIHVDDPDNCDCGCHDNRHTNCCINEDEHLHSYSCSCDCCHEEEASPLSKILLSIGILLLICAVIASFLKIIYLPTILYALSYICIGYDTFRSLIHSFHEKNYFGETTLMTVSSLGAMMIGETMEGCMVMLLFRLGEILEHKAMEKSEDNIRRLLEMSPEIAERINNDGTTEKVSPEDLIPGDIVLVKAGNTIPCDGEVMEGCANTDTSSITGESVPVVAEQGTSVRCGYIALDGSLKVKVTVSYKDNSFSKILSILSENNRKKSRSEKFIARFARIYTPIVMALAAAVMIFGSLLTGDISSWIYKGLVFLATSCPCAFVISVPLTFFFGIGECAKNGLLVKGSEYIEKTSKITIAAYDKTGTLTKGEHDITSVITAEGHDSEEIIRLCASLEVNSGHPIAKRIVKYAEDHSINLLPADNVREISGEGIEGVGGGRKVKCGNSKILKDKKIFNSSDNTTKVYVIIDDVPVGVIQLSDTIRIESPLVIKELKKLGTSRIIMLTGDNSGSACEIAEKCGITEVYSSLEPHKKTSIIEKIIDEEPESIVAFIGDGINDAPVLSAADIGIAVAGTGSDISIETADAVILGTSLEALTKGIRCTRRIMARVKFNIAFALTVKALILILALFGIANMWTAVFGDVGVTVLVILNALRRIRIK